MAESGSDIRITIDTSYLALTGELSVVYCKDFGENWPCYNGTALYKASIVSSSEDTLMFINSTAGDMSCGRRVWKQRNN